MMDHVLPATFGEMAMRADRSWQPILAAGLEAMARADSAYMPELATNTFFPTDGRLFAAFAQPLDAVRYVLVGEGPYPRPQSATGVCFMDGAVESLWAENGLSKQVNRATSLRNFMKMLLVAQCELTPGRTGADAVAQVSQKARASGSPFIQTLHEMQGNLTRHGFLLLNAALVYRAEVPPRKEAKAWQPFLQMILSALADHADLARRTPPTLVLWGKIAEQFDALPANVRFPKVVSEHPYNLSFIDNTSMQALFGPMRLLQK